MPRNPNDFRNRLYHSNSWYNTSRAYKKSRGGLCEECSRKGLIVAGTQVHHKIKLTPENIDDPAIALCWDNLELLCDACHKAKHSAAKRWTVDAFGRVTSV